MLTNAEKRRYHRHILLDTIGEKGQEKLKSTSVLVVGAGGLGTAALQYLTAIGIGKLAIVDDDIVNEDNLQRQILYGNKDLGKLKTIIARDRLLSLNSYVNFELMNIRLNEANADSIIPRFDIIIDATDNFKTRYVINEFCLKYAKTWIYSSVYKFEGQLSVFNYKGGPDLNRIFPGIVDKQNIPDPSRSGIVGLVPGIMGSFQAHEVVKIICGYGEVLSGRLMIINFLTNQFEFVKFS